MEWSQEGMGTGKCLEIRGYVGFLEIGLID